MTITESVQNTLNTVEKRLRDELVARAEENDYNGVAYDGKYKIMGDSVRHSLNSRWLNVLRLKCALLAGQVDYLFVCTELGRSDLETLKEIHKAMPV